MLRTTTIIALLAGAAAAAVAFPTANDVRTHAETRGVMHGTPTPTSLGGLNADGSCFGGGRAEVFAYDVAIEPGNAFVRDEAYVCRGLGTYWIRREDARLARPTAAWYGPIAMDAIAGQFGLAKRIADDLETRGVTFPAFGDQPAEPGPRGELPPQLDEGGVLVALDVGPAGGADFIDDVAWVHPAASLYWANRSGGFVGMNLWAGPFPLPMIRDDVPNAVVPARLRVREKAKRRKITIRRAIVDPEVGRVRRRDYSPTDFDLGEGIEVVRILRANKRKIRLLVRVLPTATRGMRDVSVNGRTGDDLLHVE